MLLDRKIIVDKEVQVRALSGKATIVVSKEE